MLAKCLGEPRRLTEMVETTAVLGDGREGPEEIEPEVDGFEPDSTATKRLEGLQSLLEAGDRLVMR
jgi:hypothetical protein